MTTIFFYGLFMDRSLLVDQGLQPDDLGPAVLPDFRLHIGDRATLLPSPGSRAFGVVMRLSEEDATALYAEPSVAAYRPERVRVRLLADDRPVGADCYNLPPAVGAAGANPSYARKLAELVGSLGFDPAYVDEILGFSNDA
jgi:hypothetical protein